MISVQVRHASGFYVRMDLNIEWFVVDDVNKDRPKKPVFQLIFSPCRNSEAIATECNKVSIGERVEHSDAFVMLLDIIEFVKVYSQRFTRLKQ